MSRTNTEKGEKFFVGVQSHRFISPAFDQRVADCTEVAETVINSGAYGDGAARESNHSLYGVTPLGEDMLRYGFMHREYGYKGGGKRLTELDWHMAD